MANLPDLDDRTPVIVGVGVAPERADHAADDEALALMLQATRVAAADAGADAGPGALLGAVRCIAVPAGNWAYSDPGRLIGERIGAPDARTVLMHVGIPQQTLFDDVYRSILAGDLEVALIVGGEAAARAKRARSTGEPAVDTVQTDATPDVVQAPTADIITRAEIEGGIASPMAPFAIVDSALRAAEGQSLDEHRDEIAEMYADFSRVATGNPRAAFPGVRDPAFLREPGPDNRPFAFPYNKWHCAQMHVDQAAAILVTSLGAARRLGVDRERLVFPLVALESSLSVPLSERRHIHRWPAMEVLGRAADEHLGAPLAEVDALELYSCYPVALRVQQRALGLPRDRVPTITGGEAFAGGPWNNFVLQTTAAMVEHVRTAPGSTGLVTSVSGLMNKPGLAVYSTEPGRRPPIVADLAEQAAEVTERVEVAPDHHGRARVAAYTVLYDGLTPARTVVVADTDDGRRCVASSDDPELADRATREELVGTEVAVDATRFSV